MSNRFFTGLALVVFISLSAAAWGKAPDYSKEAVVIEKVATKVTFSAEGARDWQQTMSVRIQSEAALRQFGVLSFSYGSETEQLNVEYVRVRKADGSVVATPESSIRDVATEIAAAAPTYIDLRQKQVPVKALSVGDLLEYSVHSSQQKPEAPGQFWYTEYFISGSVVLDQTIQISVPKEKFAQVSSPKVKSEMHEDGGQRVYVWHYSQLEVSQPDNKKKPVAADELPKIQVTSFRNWEEVGAWWGALASAQTVVTPAIAAKAKEVTAGLTSGSEKARAIYNYVSLKYRYISISLGAGRYRPHSAAEVLANQYGDCKDKHTLFVALLKAAGMQAWPALIGAGIKFDAAVPSPAQFNHVITVVQENGKYMWLDTTSEVAPYGLLVQSIRDQQALVIPDDGKPMLMKTPLDAPFKGSDTLEVKASLAADGTLAGHFDYRLEGDNALVLRAAFRELAPAQWQALAQQISYAMSFAGDVSGVEVENLENTDKPFHYSYDYNRKNYSDWAEHKFTMPIPPLAFGPGDEADKPEEAFWAGFPGTLRYRASVRLPKEFAVEMPKDAVLKSAAADYSAQYSLKEGVLTVDRELVIKKAKVPLEEWADYQTFAQALKTDQTNFIALSDGAPHKSPDYNSEAASLLQKAAQALQAQKLSEARDLLSQAERLNPKEARLWAMYGYLDLQAKKPQDAVAHIRKEIEFHPDEIAAYQQLAVLLKNSGQRDEAIETWRGALKVMPENRVAASQLARLLLEAKRYSEVPAILEKPIAAAPRDYALQTERAHALLLDGHKEEGVAEAKRIAAAVSDSGLLNDLAYYVSDAGADTGFAKDWAEKAISQTEQTTAKADLANVSQTDIAHVNLLAAEWDTLGWVYFRQNDLERAEKYVTAAWQLNQQADVANHLAAIYEKQGKKPQAIHMWRLAAAADYRNEEAREHLKKTGVALSVNGPVQPAQELGLLRTIKIPTLPKQSGSAEFFVLVSRNGMEAAQLIGESLAFKNAAAAIQSAKYEFPFPDQGPEKLIRRGILSCSPYTTPSCQLTLLLPATTKAPAIEADSAAVNVVGPTLLMRVEPEYSQAALAARLEGTVVLSIVVNQAGIPEDVAVVQSLGMGLDENAEECVKKWRFNPGTKDGKPVKVRAKVAVSFQMEKTPQ
jgi:TonB family protein